MKKILLVAFVVFVVNTKAQIITTVCGNGTGAYAGDGGQATTAELSLPTGVTFDAASNLYIADLFNNRIRKISSSGIISTVAGGGSSGLGDGGQATAAEISMPSGVVLDGVGNLYIADYNNQRIRKVNTLGIISTVAGNGTGNYSGDGGAGTMAELANPTGITFDNSDNLYIADFNNNRIRKVNTVGIISTFVGNGTQGFSGDGGNATAAELWSPSGIVFDAAGNLYIADDGNHRVRMVNTAGIINTIAGTGIQGFTGDGGQATAAELTAFGIVLDAIGNLYIADDGNNRIRMVNTAGIINTIAGNGTAGFSGDGGQANVAELNDPQGIVFDALGNLYIADSYNQRIRMITNVGHTTGIKQFANTNEQANIYPNPNNGSFVIEPQNTLYNVHCTVYDVNGKAVLNQTINGKTTIDANSLNEGVYNISLISNEGVVNKKLVIVR